MCMALLVCAQLMSWPWLFLSTLSRAQSLTVVNSCSFGVFLYTTNSYGSIDQNVQVGAGVTTDLGISSDWDGAINVGKSISDAHNASVFQ